jgi:hypothetical protein
MYEFCSGCFKNINRALGPREIPDRDLLSITPHVHARLTPSKYSSILHCSPSLHLQILPSQFIVPAPKPSPVLYIFTQSTQCLVYSARRIIQFTALKLHKEDVLERNHLGRPAVYACQIEGSDLEALKHRCQSTWSSMVNCERDEGLSLGGFAGRSISPLSEDEESRCVILSVFDALRKNVDIVDLCCELACDCCACAGCVFLHHLCSSTRRTDVDPLNPLQVCTEERFALSECLWMAEYSLDVLNAVQRTCPGLQWRWSRLCRCTSAGHDRRVGSGPRTLLAK